MGISIGADGDQQLRCAHIDSRSIRMQDRQRVISSLALLGHCSSKHAGRMPGPRTQRSSAKTGNPHHMSVRNPRPTLIGTDQSSPSALAIIPSSIVCLCHNLQLEPWSSTGRSGLDWRKPRFMVDGLARTFQRRLKLSIQISGNQICGCVCDLGQGFCWYSSVRGRDDHSRSNQTTCSKGALVRVRFNCNDAACLRSVE
jgi:hypothetical protein